jgi:protein-disulfide isomerase
VRLGYWQFAFLGDESKWAAEASECANDQGKFWEYHDLLFNSQSGENQGAFSKANLKKFAADLGLDAAKFNDCLDSNRYTSQIDQDLQVAQQIGVRSTPTFIVNGQPVMGAQPFEQFQSLIEGFLNKQ